jgi:hypothetical protein
MNKVKVEQIAWVAAAAAVTAGMIYFVKDGAAATAIAITFTTVIGGFIGVDLAVMINKTARLPAGEYKTANKHRYVLSLALFALLLLEAFVISAQGRGMDGVYASFGIGFLLIIGLLVAGIEGNKIATGEGGAG